jgi:hypothetical protein
VEGDALAPLCRTAAHARGKLTRLYTSNIDCLEAQCAGFPAAKVSRALVIWSETPFERLTLALKSHVL